MSEHNIKIVRKGTIVEVQIPTDINYGGDDKYMPFTCERGNEFDAELLVRYLNKRHADQIQAIRKAEFFSGWKFAKAKKCGKKRFEWFFRTMKNRATHE